MQEIEKLLSDLSGFADDIDSILGRKDRLGDEDIISLKAIYRRRLPVLKELHKIISSEEGKNFINCNLDLWKNKILPIIDKDKEQVRKIGACTKELGNELRGLMKQKMLLVYTTGKKQ